MKNLLIPLVIGIFLLTIGGTVMSDTLDALKLQNLGLKENVRIVGVYTGEDNITGIATNGIFLYITADDTPTKVVKVHTKTLMRVASLSLSTEDKTQYYNIIFDGRYIYISRRESTLNLIKIDAGSLERIATYNVSEGDVGEPISRYQQVYGIAYDGTYIYLITAGGYPRLVKIDPETMTFVSKLTITSISSPRDLVYDGTYLYTGDYTSPGKILKINPSAMSEVSSLTLATGEDYVTGLAYDGTYLYASLYTSPGKVVKIDPSTMTKISTLTLQSDEKQLWDIMFDGTYLYATAWWQYGKIIKIDPYSMSRVSARMPDYPNYKSLQHLCYDGKYIYATYNGSPGQVFKFLWEHEGTLSGTTTDSFVPVLSWLAGKFTKKTIIISNVSSVANSLDYEVYSYSTVDGVAFQETSGTLAQGDVIRIALNNVHAKILVKVKSTTSGNAADYQIDYVGEEE